LRSGCDAKAFYHGPLGFYNSRIRIVCYQALPTSSYFRVEVCCEPMPITSLGILISAATCGLPSRFARPGTVAILAQGTNLGCCGLASLLRNEGMAFVCKVAELIRNTKHRLSLHSYVRTLYRKSVLLQYGNAAWGVVNLKDSN
jgi:hypothetical protein